MKRKPHKKAKLGWENIMRIFQIITGLVTIVSFVMTVRSCIKYHAEGPEATNVYIIIFFVAALLLLGTALFPQNR